MELHGNPNIIVNKQGIEFGQFMNGNLNKMDMDDLINISESRQGKRIKIVEAFQSASLRSQSYTR